MIQVIALRLYSISAFCWLGTVDALGLAVAAFSSKASFDAALW